MIRRLLDVFKFKEGGGPIQAPTKIEEANDVEHPPCSSGTTMNQQFPNMDHSHADQSDEMEVNESPSPYIPECEVFECTEAAPEAKDRFQSCDCKKNFIPVGGVKLEDLPKTFRDQRSMDEIKILSDRTVKLKVRYVSENRPDTHPNSSAPYPYAEYKGSRKVGRCGTGYIYDGGPSQIVGEKCPCPDCKKSSRPKKKFVKVSVLTAAHVVYDDSEAERTVCEVFYDSEKRDSVKLLYGVQGVDEKSRGLYDRYENSDLIERCGNDLFYMECVTHDMRMYKVLESTLNNTSNSCAIHDRLPVIVSHPHGISKQISFGTYRDYSIRFSEAHSSTTYYIVPAHTDIRTKVDVILKYPGFFERYRAFYGKYFTTQPFKIYVQCDSSQTIRIHRNEEYAYFVFLPKDSTITSLNGTTEFSVEDLTFLFSDLLCIFRKNFISHHIIYDIPTCKGSSGALLAFDILLSSLLRCHFGKLPNGLNRSGSYKDLYMNT